MVYFCKPYLPLFVRLVPLYILSHLYKVGGSSITMATSFYKYGWFTATARYPALRWRIALRCTSGEVSPFLNVSRCICEHRVGLVVILLLCDAQHTYHIPCHGVEASFAVHWPITQMPFLSLGVTLCKSILGFTLRNYLF